MEAQTPKDKKSILTNYSCKWKYKNKKTHPEITVQFKLKESLHYKISQNVPVTSGYFWSKYSNTKWQ